MIIAEMPIYEFICEDCKEEIIELIQKYEDSTPLCSICNKPTKRLISTSALRFIGTDFKTKRHVDIDFTKYPSYEVKSEEDKKEVAKAKEERKKYPPKRIGRT